MIYVAKTKDLFYVGSDMFCYKPRNNFSIYWYANNLSGKRELDFTLVPISVGRKFTEEQAYRRVEDLLRYFNGNVGLSIFDKTWRVLSDTICLCELDYYGKVENCIPLT